MEMYLSQINAKDLEKYKDLSVFKQENEASKQVIEDDTENIE